MDVAGIWPSLSVRFRGTFYASKGNGDDDTRYLRSDGAWQTIMDIGGGSSKGGGTYFPSQSEAIQCCQRHGIQFVIKGNENGGEVR